MTNEQIPSFQSFEPPKPQVDILAKLNKLPPEIHRLPSSGLLYKNGELSNVVVNGELEFYTYTASDELDLRSPDLLMDGRAIERVIKRRVPGVLNPLDLFSKDLDYIMLVLQKVSYGNEYEVKYTHTCSNAKEHNYVIPLSKVISNAKSIDPTTLTSKYTLTLSKGDVTYKVGLRPLRAKHTIDIIQNMDNDKSEEERRRNLFSMFIFSISDVDGITDMDQIFAWLANIPIQWIDEIGKRIEEISNWGLSYTFEEHVCRDCGDKIQLSLNVNPLTFFIKS